MKIHAETFTVHKLFPLTISRGTTSETTNIWLKISDEDIEGWGEASPFSGGKSSQTTETLLTACHTLEPILKNFKPWERQAIENALIELNLPTAVQAAVDMALYDWLGKKVSLPLWKMWGLDPDHIPPTSVTIGINSLDIVRERVGEWLKLANVQIFKVKLGNPEGIEADKDLLMTVREVAPVNALIYVDANGGWNLANAIKMSQWLAELGIKYIEQPLNPADIIPQLAILHSQAILPIFVDESCWKSQDIYQLANCIDGVNIKLMKSGGITEALRMVHTARSCGLKVMFGCYSDSSLANSAAAQLSPLATYIDLDSHLNLIDDPFIGITWQEGRLSLNNLPGLGVRRKML